MAKAGVTKKTDPGLGRTVARLLQESGKRQVDLCEFSHWSRAYVSYICTERRKWPSFDKAKVIADFFSLSLDQLWIEHLKDLVDAGVELTETQKKNLAEGVNLPNPTVMHDGNNNREYLQPVAPSGNGSDYTLPEILGIE